MNQQEKIRAAKLATFDRLKEVLGDFEQVGEFNFASLEEVEGEEWWTITTIQTKKKFDIDDAVDEWEYARAQAEKKKAEKEKKNQRRAD